MKALGRGIGLLLWMGFLAGPGGAVAGADDTDAAARGREAMTARCFLGPAWSREAYAKAGELWRDEQAPDPESDPEGYARAFNARYGLHPAPFPNDGLPMGLKRAVGRDGRVGLSIDCLLCHGGSIGGTSYVGLGNSQLDLKALLDDLTRADGKSPPPAPFTVNSTRGTNNAGQIAVALLSMRNEDLTPRKFPILSGAWLPELDTPAWWVLHKKRTKYYDGRTDARAARSNMQFFLGEMKQEDFEALEPTFLDVDAYLKSLRPPEYPFPIDAEKAGRGRVIFDNTCSRCHGTYGPDGAYPNKIVPLDVIGTDPARAKGMSDRLIAHYNATWFGGDYPVEEPMVGYQAPPLDGVWATAPYLHNGSVPTLHHLLKSSERPRVFTRHPSTDFEHYDRDRLGWAFEAFETLPPGLSRRESRRFVDTKRWGLGNGGHTFGDELSDAERGEVIEYLKTL